MERYPAYYGLPIAVQGLLPWLLGSSAIGMMMRRPWGRSLSMGTSALSALFFLAYSVVLLVAFMPISAERGMAEELLGHYRLAVILNALWYLLMVPFFVLLFFLAFKSGSRDAVEIAEEDRDRRAERKGKVRLPLRGAILWLGIVMLLRSICLGVGALSPLVGYLILTPRDGELVKGIDERMPYFLVVMLGGAAAELLLAMAGFVLSIGLIARLKLARWPALLWGFATVAVTLVPLAFLFYSLKPGYDQWWCMFALSDALPVSILTTRIMGQIRWFNWGFVASFALFVSLVWTLLNPRFSAAFPAKPTTQRKQEEDEEEES